MNELLDYQALAATPVSETPFRHVVVPNFLPPEVRARVFDDFPPKGRGGSFPPEALRLGQTAAALMKARVQTREKDGQIHRDSDCKRVTALLYLNPDQDEFADASGCLRLLRNAEDLEDYAVEVPPTHGTFLVFPNAPDAWHGHKTYVGPRFSVQLNYMTDDKRARAELFRHRLSAVVKRLI